MAKRALSPTVKERAIQRMIAQSKKHRSPLDRTSNYHEQLGELARAADVPVDVVISEWEERSSVREYLGGVSRDEAEFLAMDDVRDRFRRIA